MPVIRHADSRRTETPAAVMTTLASPTQGGAGHALWRVDMAPGAQGPVHVIDAEQIWTCLEGHATFESEGRGVIVGPGDTVVLPAEVTRQISADSDKGFIAVVTAPPGARAAVPGGADPVVPLWSA